MKSIVEMVIYDLQIYLKSNKFLLPLASWISVLFIIYSTKPIELVSAFMVSIATIFFIMIWIGYTYFKNIDKNSRNLMILFCRNRNLYDIANYIALFVLGFVLSFVGVFVNFLNNVLNGFELFTRSLTVNDSIYAFILHLAVVLISISVTAISRPVILKNRKVGLLFLVVLSTLSIMKIEFLNGIPVLKYISYIISAVNKITGLFSGTIYFSDKLVVYALFYSVVYSILLILLSQFICTREKL